MALFGGGGNSDAEKAALKERFAQSDVVRLLVNDVVERANDPEYAWLFRGQNYYDSCSRRMTIEPDGFTIEWTERMPEEYVDQSGATQTREVTKTIEELGLGFTKSGYKPLLPIKNEKGKGIINQTEMCKLLYEVVKEKLEKALPDCGFRDQIDVSFGVDTKATSTYRVPAMTFKDWY